MLVHDANITIDVDKDTIEMMMYCDTHGCGRDCPYMNMCNEFEFKYGTVPYNFYTEDGKPLTSL